MLKLTNHTRKITHKLFEKVGFSEISLFHVLNMKKSLFSIPFIIFGDYSHHVSFYLPIWLASVTFGFFLNDSDMTVRRTHLNRNGEGILHRWITEQTELTNRVMIEIDEFEWSILTSVNFYTQRSRKTKFIT